MRNLMVVIFVLSSLFIFAQGENKTDASGYKQGEWKEYYSNGYVKYVGKYKDNKPVGVFKYYYDSGSLQAKLTHAGSHTYSNVYYDTGEIMSVGKYEEGERDSIWNSYDKKGYKISEEFYLNGKKEGISKNYYPTGQTAEEKEYLNDFENGIWKQYFANGKIKLNATYVDGVLSGRATYYGNNGRKAVTGVFVKGARDGYWTYYEEDGKTVRKKEQYKNGYRIDDKKGDDVIDTREIDYIPESVVSPENFMTPR